MSSKQKFKKGVGPLLTKLVRADGLVKYDSEQAEILNTFCALVFKGKVSPQVSMPRSDKKANSEPLSEEESQELYVHMGHTQDYGTWWDGSEGAKRVG